MAVADILDARTHNRVCRKAPGLAAAPKHIGRWAPREVVLAAEVAWLVIKQEKVV